MYLLVIFLIVLLVTTYLLTNKDIMSPTFLTISVYLIGAIIASIGLQDWHVKYNNGTTVLIIVAIAFMALGEFFARITTKKRSVSLKIPEPANSIEVIEIPLFLQVISLTIACIGCFLYYRRMIQIAQQYGYSDSNLLFFIRTGLSDSEERTGYLVVILKNFAQALAFVNIYSFIFNFINLKKKKYIIKYSSYLLPVVPVLVIYFISSSRYTFLKLFSYIIICFLLLYLKLTRKRINQKIINKVALTLLFFGVAFYVIYALTGQSRGSFNNSSVLDKFIVYGGSSIIGLSEYIERGMPLSDTFGAETLTGVFSLIKRFNPSITEGNKLLEHFNLTNSLTSNIYTMIRSLIADYGIIGMLLIEFFIGLIFTNAYLSTMRKPKESISIIIFAYFVYGLIYQLFTPLLFTDIGSITQIFELLWIIIIYQKVKKYHRIYNHYDC